MRRRSELPRELHGQAFRVTAAAEVSPSRSRLRANDLHAPSRGVRSVGIDDSTVEGRCRNFEPRMTHGQAFSHTTAAQLYDVPLPLALDSDTLLHVTVPAGGQPPRVRGIRGHETSPATEHTRVHSGFTVVDPATVWCQLASQLSPYDLVAAGDFLVSGRVTDFGREPPLTTMEALREAIIRHGGRRGVRAMRTAFDRVRTGVDSRPETWLRLLLVDDGLPEPVVNQPIFSASGRRLGKPDLAYPWARVVFEYEGDEHRVSKRRFRSDITRREEFEAERWRVIRVVADDVFVARVQFLRRVRKILKQQEGVRQ